MHRLDMLCFDKSGPLKARAIGRAGGGGGGGSDDPPLFGGKFYIFPM